MTEQEAAAFAERLTRIWAPEEDRSRAPEYQIDEEEDYYHFRLWITNRIYLKVGGRDEGPSRGRRFFELFEWSGPTGPHRNLSLGELRVWADTGELTDAPHPTCSEDTKRWFADFSARYLSFFRRNCWLSGANIEASAHEKAEWMQGFTREEIEAWNLKM